MQDSPQKYHEVAHASHFTNTGNAYWVNVMIAESIAYLTLNDSHGSSTFVDADIIAVAESWAEHVARSFADLKWENNICLSY